MNDRIYENIAKLIVRANELRKAERISAENDYSLYQQELDAGSFGDVNDLGIESRAEEYSAYLNRIGEAENIAQQLEDEAEKLTQNSEILSAITDKTEEIEEKNLDMKNAENQREFDYEKSRDEKDDYFYNLKKKYDSKKSSSSSSSKKTTSKEKTMKGKDYIDKMPVFTMSINIHDRLQGMTHAKTFREKALEISSNGTKKASKSQLNSLVKEAEKCGASDKYIEWLHNVCGYF